MSDFSLTLVLHFKTSKNFNGIAKVRIISEKTTPFGGIFHVREQFSRFVGQVIDKVLGLRWQGTHLRRHEQRIRVGKAAEVVHGREYSVPADGTHTKLLQFPHGQAGHESIRTEENQPHQSLRLQVHQRARKVDKDGKALSTEHLHAQQIISEPFRAH